MAHELDFGHLPAAPRTALKHLLQAARAIVSPYGVDIECPTCHASPGYDCEVNGVSVAPHESRREAIGLAALSVVAHEDVGF